MYYFRETYKTSGRPSTRNITTKQKKGVFNINNKKKEDPCTHLIAHIQLPLPYRKATNFSFTHIQINYFILIHSIPPSMDMLYWNGYVYIPP